MIKKPPFFAEASAGKEKGAWYYEIENPGYNYRITDIQCALGLSQFKKINGFIKRRREIIAIYNKAFKDIEEIIIPVEKDYIRSFWHLYPVQVQGIDRKKYLTFCKKKGLASMSTICYPSPSVL